VPLRFFLAERYLKAGQLDKAATLYKAALEKPPKVAAHRSLAEIYRKQKKYGELLTLLGDAVDKGGLIDMLGSEAKAIVGDAEVVRGLTESAREQLKKNPQQLGFGPLLAVGLIALDNKTFDTSFEFLQAALAAKPAPKPARAAEALLTWGMGLMAAERYDEAAKIFQRGIDEKLLPDDAAFQYQLAGALAMADRTEEALAAARKARDGRKESPRFAGRVAWVLHHAKRNADALKAYEELVAKFDSDRTSDESREVLREARLAASGLCVQLKRPAEAEDWLEQVLDEFPDDISADNDLGYLWADQGKHLQRAVRMIQAAVDAEPDSAAYRDSLGWVYYRLGRVPEAIEELEKAAAKQPDPEVLDHLATAYDKAGRADKARDAWRRAAEGYRKEKDEDKAGEIDKKIKD
jgi:tetratricopeptide (TPR) repeat protein